MMTFFKYIGSLFVLAVGPVRTQIERLGQTTLLNASTNREKAKKRS